MSDYSEYYSMSNPGTRKNMIFQGNTGDGSSQYNP